MALVTSNGREEESPQKDTAGSTLRWLDDEIVTRLNTCSHLLGNGRTDDRNAGIQLVLKEIVDEIRKRSRGIGPSDQKRTVSE